MCQAPESDTNTPLGPSSETPPLRGISFLSLGNATVIRCPCVSTFREVHGCPQMEEETKAVTTDGGKGRHLGGGGLPNLSWNVQKKGSGPEPFGARNGVSR